MPRSRPHVPQYEAPARGLALFVHTVLFTAIVCSGGYLYLELDKSRSEISAIRAADGGPNGVLDKYLAKSAELAKLDIDERVRQARAELDDRLEAFRRNTAARSDVEALSRRISALEDYNEAHTGKSLAFLALAASLKDDVADGRPFADVLDALEKIAGRSEEVEQLRAIGIVPGDLALVEEYAAAAPGLAFEAKHPLPPDAPWYSRALNYAKGIVKVRKVDAAPGTPDEAVARLGRLLRARDYPGAAASLEGLSLDSSFAASVRAKAAASRAADALFSRALSSAASVSKGK